MERTSLTNPLVELGVPPQDAIRSVRAARPGAVETWEQEEYVAAVRPK